MSSSMACSVECPAQKPNCLSFNISFSFKQLYNLQNTGFKSLGQSLSHLFSKLHVKMLAKAGPNGDPKEFIIEFIAKNKKRFFGGYVK